MNLGRVFLAGEQDNYICEWLGKMLHAQPCNLLRTENLNLLLVEAGQKQLPRLVLLHTALGGSRIYDFCRLFKNRFPTVPLILLTDRVEPRVRQWALLQGATDLVSATTEEERRALVQQVERYLEVRQTEIPPLETGLGAAYRQGVAVRQVVEGLNQLSQTAALYLGKLIVANYWRSSREELTLLGQTLNLFTVEFGKEITFKENREYLSIEESQAVQHWVSAFMERAQTVVQDLPDLLKSAPLSKEHRLVLSLR